VGLQAIRISNHFGKHSLLKPDVSTNAIFVVDREQSDDFRRPDLLVDEGVGGDGRDNPDALQQPLSEDRSLRYPTMG